MKFQWDRQKATKNEKKHGISFQEALTVFRDTLSITYPDIDHSADEDRFLIIGLSLSGKVLVVSHAFRNDSIRIISARRATKKERIFYENETRH
jgi:uncharacterized DUF497 family protein